MRRLIGSAIFLTVFAAADLAAGEQFWSFGREEKGSGTLETETRPLDSFTRIHLESGADITITVGQPQSVKVTIDDNLLDNVITEVRRHTLVIAGKESYSTDKGCRIEITVPTVEYLKISGSGDVDIKEMTGEEFEYLLQGSGDLTMEGKVAYLTIEIAGSGDIDTKRLKAEHVAIEVNGSGDARVYAARSFKGTVSGSGNITVFGNPPHTSAEVFGSGEIAHEDSH